MNSHVRRILLPVCSFLALTALLMICPQVICTQMLRAQAPQTPPSQTPPAPSSGAQTPPAQTPITQSGTQQGPTLSPGAPPPPLPPDEYKNFSDISIEPFYWLTKMHPDFRAGKKNVDSTPSGVDFPGKGKPAEGVVITTPAGRSNQLEFSYFRTKDQGNITAATNLTLFSQGYSQGDIIATGYQIQSAKITWNFLSYPDPPGIRKFRFRTMYGIDYTSVSAHFDAPQDTNALPVRGSRSIIFPALGVGVEYHLSKHFYLEAKASGFAWPHKSVQGDGTAQMFIRFGQFDVVLGGKDMYFKTSPNSDYYLKGNVWGPFGGVRWTFK